MSAVKKNKREKVLSSFYYGMSLPPKNDAFENWIQGLEKLLRCLTSGVLRCQGNRKLSVGHAPINHRVPEEACAEAIQTVEKRPRCGVVGPEMTTLVLDNGAYNAKIGYSHDSVS